MQDHVHSKSQPENIGFLERLRALLDEYDGRTMVGEVGDAPYRKVQIMADYTQQGRLHMAYSFDMLGPEFTPSHFRAKIEGFFAGAPDGWPMWAFSNHDVPRHLTRWLAFGAEADVARLACAMLLSFEGSVCLYQGEEAGQLETDIHFDELTDPPGIRFWPDYKGRDGCRTPMVWEQSEQRRVLTRPSHGCRSRPPQLARNVAAQVGQTGSVLEFYRQMLAYRRATPALHTGRSRFFDAGDTILAFARGEDLACVFNLSPDPVTLIVTGEIADGPIQAASLSQDRLSLGPSGFAFLQGHSGPISIRP